MGFRLNPITGQFDVCGSSTPKWAFNPFTGKFDRDHDVGGFVFNPFTGELDSVAETPAFSGYSLLWGANDAIEWSVGFYMEWQGTAATALQWDYTGAINFGDSNALQWG